MKMTIRKSHLLVLLTGLMGHFTATAQNLSDDDLAVLVDKNWNGELMYVDYANGQETILPVNLNVDHEKEGVFVFNYSYPNEPQADTAEKLKIKGNGTRINGEEFILRGEENGCPYVLTKKKGYDNNREAHMTMQYTLCPEKLIMEKKVRYAGSKKPGFVRNRYSFYSDSQDMPTATQ